MKKILVGLMLFLAAIMPSMLRAQSITMSSTPTTTNTIGHFIWNSQSVFAKQFAVSNGVVYTFFPLNKNTLLYWNATSSATSMQEMSTGGTAGQIGWGICTDDAGNVIYAHGTAYNAKVSSVRVLKKSSGYGVPVSMSNAKDITNVGTIFNDTRVATNTTFFFASGNCYEGRGALWFTNGTYIAKIELYNGQATFQRVYTLHINNVTDSHGNFTQYFGGSTMAPECSIRPIGHNRFLFQNNNVLSILKIQETGSVVEVTDYLGWYRNPSADLDSIGGHEILVRPYSEGRTWNGKITVQDRTAGTNLANGIYAVGVAPFYYSTNPYYNYSNVNAWCEFEKVDEQTLALYTYVPGTYDNQTTSRYGFAKYLIKVNNINTNACTNVVAGTPYESELFPGRQDVDITWTAPSGTAPTEYAVYAQATINSYTVPCATTSHVYFGTKAPKPLTGWVKLGTTTSTSFTHADAKWYQQEWYDDIFPTTYKYKVVPIYNGIAGSEAISNEVQPKFLCNVPQWDEEHIRNYDGYCKVQLFWKQTYGLQPNYYRVYRDGKLIADNVAAWNYIDQGLSQQRKYTYTIEACYSNFEEKRTGIAKTFDIGIRDWGKPTYKISKVYDYSIPNGETQIDDVAKSINPTIVFSKDHYKQAAFHNGYWYIMTNGGINVSNAMGGNILKVSAGDPNDSNDPYAKAGQYVTNHCQVLVNYDKINYVQSTGIAVDNGGNIFIRQNTTDATWHAYPLRAGSIYKPDGTLMCDVDLSHIAFDEYKGVVTEPYPGRVDYYYMTGDLTNIGGVAYLYIAPTSTTAVYVVKLTRTAASTVTASEYYTYNETGKNSVTGARFYENAENYAFPVLCKGREGEFIHQLRSHAYISHSSPDKTTSTRNGVIYETRSRVNNTGGCTLEFNGELFVITPQNLFSVNTGNFYVGMAERETRADGTAETAAEADLTSIIPADSWFEGDQSSVYSDANGISLYAEIAKNADGTIVDTDNNGEADYAYIYMYVPATRIAKFKLETSSLFPPSQVYLSVDAVYGESEGNRTDDNDLLRYDAVSTWDEIIGYGETAGGNAYYNVKGYEFRIEDADGTILGSTTINVSEVSHVTENGANVVKDKNGNIIPGLSWAQNTTSYTYTDNNGNPQTVELNYYTYTYVVENVKAMDDDGNKRLFSSYVTVLYKGVHATTNSLQGLKSVETYAAADNGYAPMAPMVEAEITKSSTPQWADWNANNVKDENDGYWDTYDIKLNITEPEATEPVSNYSITIDKSNDPGFTPDDKIVELTEFYLYDPSNANSNSEGYVLVTDGVIPGDYDFSQALTDNKPTVVVYEKDYIGTVNADESIYDEQHPNPEDGTKNLGTWEFIVSANYADTNPIIAQSANNGSGDSTIDVSTAVENIEYDSKLIVFPVPTDGILTIYSPQPIKAINVTSIAGNIVKSIAGNNDSSMIISLDDLAQGYYFITVNNLKPLRIIKK